MANALYTEYKNSILGSWTHSFPDLDTDNIKAMLVDHTDDTPAPTTDQDLDDINQGTPVATSGNMTSPSIASGAIDFADFTFTSVSGDAADSLNFYKDSGTDTTSPLIVYIDTATGLPVTPNGGDINVVLNASGLFGF